MVKFFEVNVQYLFVLRGRLLLIWFESARIRLLTLFGRQLHILYIFFLFLKMLLLAVLQPRQPVLFVFLCL